MKTASIALTSVGLLAGLALFLTGGHRGLDYPGIPAIDQPLPEPRALDPTVGSETNGSASSRMPVQVHGQQFRSAPDQPFNSAERENVKISGTVASVVNFSSEDWEVLGYSLDYRTATMKGLGTPYCASNVDVDGHFTVSLPPGPVMILVQADADDLISSCVYGLLEELDDIEDVVLTVSAADRDLQVLQEDGSVFDFVCIESKKWEHFGLSKLISRPMAPCFRSVDGQDATMKVLSDEVLTVRYGFFGRSIGVLQLDSESMQVQLPAAEVHSVCVECIEASESFKVQIRQSRALLMPAVLEHSTAQFHQILARQPFTILVSGRNGLMLELDMDAHKSSDLQTVQIPRLPEASFVDGLITDSSGRPVDGFRIEVSGQYLEGQNLGFDDLHRLSVGEPQSAITSDGGRFSLGPLYGDELDVEVFGPRNSAFRHQFKAKRQADLERVALPTSLDSTGTITCSLSTPAGEPVQSQTTVSLRVVGDGVTRERAFRFAPSEAVCVTGLDPGDYSIDVGVDGYAQASFGPVTVVATSQHISIPLEYATRLELTIVDEGLQPIRNRNLSFSQGGRDPLVVTDLGTSARRVELCTDSQGKVRVAGLPLGSVEGRIGNFCDYSASKFGGLKFILQLEDRKFEHVVVIDRSQLLSSSEASTLSVSLAGDIRGTSASLRGESTAGSSTEVRLLHGEGVATLRILDVTGAALATARIVALESGFKISRSSSAFPGRSRTRKEPNAMVDLQVPSLSVPHAIEVLRDGFQTITIPLGEGTGRAKLTVFLE